MFPGACRLRSSDDRREEREADHATAGLLAVAGLMPWRTDGPVTAVDLDTEGARVSAPVWELREWGVFQSVERRRAAAAAAEVASWLQGQEPEEVARHDMELLTLRRRGVGDVPTGEVAAHHQALTGALGRALGYAGPRAGAACVPLFYGVHHRLLGAGERVDLHAHLPVYVERTTEGRAALDWLVGYLGKGWEVHVGEARPADSPGACAGVAYAARGTSWAPEVQVAPAFGCWLATYVRQVHIDHHLHRHQPLGPLRRHVGDLSRARVRPVHVQGGDLAGDVGGEAAPAPSRTPILVTPVSLESPEPPPSPGEGAARPAAPARPVRVLYRPIRVRPPRRPRAVPSPAGPRVLCARLSWLPEGDGNDALRPVLLVRGWDAGDPAGSWAKVRAAYDLDGLIWAAREAVHAREWAAREASDGELCDRLRDAELHRHLDYLDEYEVPGGEAAGDKDQDDGGGLAGAGDGGEEEGVDGATIGAARVRQHWIFGVPRSARPRPTAAMPLCPEPP